MSEISIVIPAYNAEKYIAQCIESVINQTFSDLEIICVDDGSKDKTLSIMNEFKEKDSRINVISKPNSGYGNSVNIGIKSAKGLYIGIIESDDFASSNMFEKLYALSENGSVDIIKGNFWDYFDFENKTPESIVNRERKDTPVLENAFSIREQPEILWGHPSIWSAIYRKEFLDKNNITFLEVPGGGWVDNPFFFETLCLAQSIKWTDEPVYYYRKTNADSSSNNISDLTLPLRRMIDNLEVLEKYNYLDEHVLKFAYARALMYLDGVKKESGYIQQYNQVSDCAYKMMNKINRLVIRKHFHIWDQISYYRSSSPLKSSIKKKHKILIYNWVPFDNPLKAGGGVTVYCQNLISEILARRPDVDVYFLSSGWAYSASTKECYINLINTTHDSRCFNFEIINSPIPAPQKVILNNPAIALENRILRNVFKKFVNSFGNFEVIHFNNLEGLSLDIFDLAKELPSTRFLYSLHNYIPFCVTGFYYQRHTHSNCNPSSDGRTCVECIGDSLEADIPREMYGRALAGKRTGEILPKDIWLEGFSFEEFSKISTPESMALFCEAAKEKINSNMDCIIAVSERVKEIAIKNGISEEKIVTSYIGTRIADHQIFRSNAKKSDYFKLVYLGSDPRNEEKGYPFLLSALSAMSEKYAERIDIVLTAMNGLPDESRNKLNHYHSVKVINGYSHSDLRKILSGAHIGIIPVLWEDNLPQIAIEMIAMGVPILCSKYGGAMELIGSGLFHFSGGDVDDFINHLTYFVDNQEMLDEFWRHHNGLKTMTDHWHELERLYGLTDPENLEIDPQTYTYLLEENEFLYDNLLFYAKRYYEGLQEIDSLSFKYAKKVSNIILWVPEKVVASYRLIKFHGFRKFIRYLKSYGARETFRRAWVTLMNL